jgi:hypothetical protein
VFLAKGLQKVADQNLDAGERIDLIEVTFDEYMQLITKPNFRDRETAFFLLKAEKDPKLFAKIKDMFNP